MATNRKTDKVEVFVDPIRLDMNEGEVIRVQINDEITEYTVGQEAAMSPQEAKILRDRMGFNQRLTPEQKMRMDKAQNDPALN